MSFHDRLIHELTAMDRRDSTRRGYNPYALPQYCAAASHCTEEIESGIPPAVAFSHCFNPTRGMHGIATRLGLALDVERGRWIMTGATS